MNLTVTSDTHPMITNGFKFILNENIDPKLKENIETSIYGINIDLLTKSCAIKLHEYCYIDTSRSDVISLNKDELNNTNKTIINKLVCSNINNIINFFLNTTNISFIYRRYLKISNDLEPFNHDITIRNSKVTSFKFDEVDLSKKSNTNTINTNDININNFVNTIYINLSFPSFMINDEKYGF